MLSLLWILLSWTAQTTLDVQQVGDAQPSPDGTQTLFVTTESHLDGDKTTYHHHLVLPNSTVDVPRNAAPRWSPDGRWIAYISPDVIALVDASSGVSHTLPAPSVTAFSWAPDSQSLAYATPEALRHLTLDGDDTLLCNTGFIYQITWAPDGDELIVTHAPSMNLEDILLRSELTIFDWTAQEAHPLNLPGCQAAPSYSPDGQWIAFLQSQVPAQFYMDCHVALYQRATQEVHPFLPLEPLGIHSIIGWADSQHLISYQPCKTQSRLFIASLDAASWTCFSTINTQCPRLNASATHIGFISQTSDTPPEVYVTPTTHFEPTQVTHLNAHLPPVPPTQVIRWKAPDGLEIEGLLTLPAGPPPYPLILSIHGGPMSYWNETFTGVPYPHPVAPLAQAGYAVLRPNVRGSLGYGRDFRKANFDDWGGHDLQDALSGVDLLISQGIADSGRLAVVGWSYGGYLAAYAVTQTDRFKTASIGAAILNIPTMATTTDLPSFIPNALPTTYRSPITHAAGIKTPLLIQHGTADQRIPYSQSLEFIQELNAPYQFTSYEQMQHEPTSEYFCVMQENITWIEGSLK